MMPSYEPAPLLHRQIAERAAGRAEQLLFLTVNLSRALTPEGVATVMTASGLDALGASICSLVLLDDDRTTLRIIDSKGLDAKTMSHWASFPLSEATPISDAIRRGEPVWLESTAARAAIYPHLARDYPTDGERSWAVLPLTLNRDAIGAVGLVFPGTQPFDIEERTFLTTVASLCAQALERARLLASERNALAAADEALALLNTVIDSAPLGMAFIDKEFRYRRVNVAMAQINGRTPAQHIGRQSSELFPSLSPLWEHYWRKVLETGEPIINLELSAHAYQSGMAELGYTNIAADIEALADQYALVSYYPVPSASGELIGIGVIVQDITERKREEQMRTQLLASAQAARKAEQIARAHAEDAVHLRDAFLSIAAHELRTPLTSLLMQAQILYRRLNASTALNDQNQRSLEVIISQAQRLNRLISDILDGARLETGQLTIHCAMFDLGALMRQVVEDLQLSLSQHQLIYTIESDPLMIEGDAVRLDQVLQNLLSNAVKYSPRGGTIELRAARRDNYAVLTVRDQGIGISAEAIPKLFERFYRAADANTQQMSGAGVGLYVVKEIVLQHGGIVTVESDPGHGSTFTVTLPLRAGG